MLQFPEDAGPLAHPIRPESYIEINNFYTSTVYNKGAEVIRMMSSFMGRSKFVKGVKLYLDRYDGQAATCEQFISTMEEAGQVDLKQFRLWYSQAGTPTLKIKREFDGSDVLLSIEQSCPATPGQPEKAPFEMPVVIGWLDENGKELSPDFDDGVVEVENGYLLKLSEQHQRFRFKGLPGNAVPSLLRGFSAPVKTIDDLSDTETARLLKYDTDPYVRWQSGQDLMADYLLATIEANWSGSPTAVKKFSMISDAFVAAISDVSLDAAFVAELVTLPSEIYLGQMQDILTPVEIHNAYVDLKTSLVDAHFDLIIERFDDLAVVSKGTGQHSKGVRKLRNLLLEYMALSKTYSSEARSRALALYARSENMTEQLAALTVICHSDWTEKDDVVNSFYRQWEHDDLVIDKWFAVQAQNPDSNVITHITNLMDHSAFTYENPNRLRSLISTFSLLNQVNFHSVDGSGYNLLSSVIAKVDLVNPQTAARMVAPLGRWMRLDDERKERMKKSLYALQSQPGLSNDVKELVEKSLR
jgi:aminopeptidase N